MLSDCYLSIINQVKTLDQMRKLQDTTNQSAHYLIKVTKTIETNKAGHSNAPVAAGQERQCWLRT